MKCVWSGEGWEKQYARPVPLREALLRDQALMWLTERPDRTARNDGDRKTEKKCLFLSNTFIQLRISTNRLNLLETFRL